MIKKRCDTLCLLCDTLRNKKKQIVTQSFAEKTQSLNGEFHFHYYQRNLTNNCGVRFSKRFSIKNNSGSSSSSISST